MSKTIFTAITLLALSSGAAMAQSVSAGFPDTVTQALKDLGHNAEATTDSYGDPMIEANYGDLKYAILFYGCEENKDCKDLQFRASFELDDGTTPDQVYGFNSDWMDHCGIVDPEYHGHKYPANVDISHATSCVLTFDTLVVSRESCTSYFSNLRAKVVAAREDSFGGQVNCPNDLQ